MSDFLTSNLRLELEKTNQAFNRWVENQADGLDSNGAKFSQKMEEVECTIMALKDNERQLEDARDLNDSIKNRQNTECEHYISQVERFKQQKKNFEQQLRKLEEEEMRESGRLEISRVENDTLRRKMEQTLNDLTHGIKLYTALGLEFQKAEGDCMKFIFTQVDPKDPSRPFYFLMFVDNNDMYQLVESCPAVDPVYLKSNVDALNNDNDIGKFVVNMRRFFVTSLTE
mmetsp:Transcript_2648/g.2765  ORF Transcript_2648/g.2765 Transcript_2648/m.2765 type:complete len:228 (+) Transcript_2648:105-788(+)